MSGSTIGGIVGGVIGFFVGGPAGAQVGFMLGSAVGGYIDPDVIEGPRLKDAMTQTSQDGIPKPWGRGTFRTAGNIIWSPTYPDGRKFREVKNKKRAGKGGPVQVTYSYFRSYAIGICTGKRKDDGTYDPIAGIIQVYRNGKLVYDARDDATLQAAYPEDGDFFAILAWVAGVRASSSKFLENATFYLGGEDIMPDATMESFEGIGNVSPNRGLVKMVINEEDVTDTQGAIPQYEFVVAVDGIGEPVSGSYVAGRTSRFQDSAFPLADPVSDYDFTGQRVSDITDDPVIYTGTSFQDVIDYYTAWYDGVDSPPDQYVAYSRAIGPDLGGDTISIFEPQESVVDRTSLTLVYNQALPDFLVNDELFSCSDIPAPPNPGISAYYSLNDGDIGFKSRPFGDVLGTNYINNCTADTPFSSLVGWQSLTIKASRKRLAPKSGAPEGTVEIPDSPGNYMYPDGTIVLGGSYESVTGNFKVLTTTKTGTQSNIICYEQGPVVRDDDPRYSDEDFWTAAYADAVANATVPSGWVYTNIPGTPDNTYPKWVSQVWQSYGTSNSVTTDKVVLGSIVADICKKCGLTSEDYDVSQLTDLVDGYKVAVQSDGVGMLLPLMAGFFFDAGEWDDKIRFIKRGGSSVMALSYEDLIAKDGSAFEITRSQEVELLRKVNVIAMDPAAGWMPTQQSAERRSSTVAAKGEQTVEIPIVADKDTQAQIADKRLKVPWAELHKYAFAVPYTQAALTPTDVVTLTDKKGITHRMRIMEMPEEGGIREVKEAAQDRQFTYTSNAVGTDHPPPNTPIEGLIGPTTIVVMNLPIWTGDQDDELGLYVAGFGPLSGWAGAEVQVSTDGGATHEPMAQITDEATIGYTTTALPTWSSSEYPSVQSVTVWLPDSPESVTYENLLRYNNRAAIQNDSGDWEILQYETVTSLGSGSYELSGLVRGRYNTTAGAAGLGASFVLLDGNVQFVRIDRSFIGVAASIRAVSYGTDPDAYPWMPYTLTSPKSQTEWPVHMVRAGRDISDNVTVTWIGRARIGTETSPQHSQYFRGYRVSFDDGGSVQTFDTTATIYTLNAAPDPVTVTVAPLNAITGAGPASTGIIV